LAAAPGKIFLPRRAAARQALIGPRIPAGLAGGLIVFEHFAWRSAGPILTVTEREIRLVLFAAALVRAFEVGEAIVQRPPAFGEAIRTRAVGRPKGIAAENDQPCIARHRFRLPGRGARI